MPCLLRLLVYACTTIVKKRALRDTLFRNHEPNHAPELSLAFCKNMPTFFPSGKYTLSICSFLENCYTVVLVHNISCPSKGCLVDNRNLHNIFSALNLRKICIKPFICNINTIFSVSFLNEILLLHWTFSLNTPSLTTFKTG